MAPRSYEQAEGRSTCVWGHSTYARPARLSGDWSWDSAGCLLAVPPAGQHSRGTAHWPDLGLVGRIPVYGVRESFGQ